MGTETKYLLVEKSVLPDIFPKIIEVKQLLSKGNGMSVNEAVNTVGISRSAYYKYKDFVFPFNEISTNSVITLHLVVEDSAGLLSQILSTIAEAKANILTINQNIPVNGLADVTVAVETHDMEQDMEVLLNALKQIPGVRRQGILSRE